MKGWCIRGVGPAVAAPTQVGVETPTRGLVARDWWLGIGGWGLVIGGGDEVEAEGVRLLI